jgi:hypothetical protein
MVTQKLTTPKWSHKSLLKIDEMPALILEVQDADEERSETPQIKDFQQTR